MRKIVENAIREEAAKLIRRHEEYARRLHDELFRRTRRTGVPYAKVVRIPTYWGCAPGFNPYHVRSGKRPERVARSMALALDEGRYQPRPAVVHEVPKSDGGSRQVSVFQVADAALSRLTYETLTHKNATRLSPRCYAYRRDVSRHDAVFHVASELATDLRVFVAEFDFRKFFDSISHEHIEKIIKDGRFLITERERKIVRAFLRCGEAPVAAYPGSAKSRERGIPQGTSISLFLANIAAFPLDRTLERLGVGFTRFADDTLIWSNNYAELCRGVDALCEAAHLMGVDINIDKSDGISILSADRERTPEFRYKKHINYLGCAISRKSIGLKDATVRRTKEALSYLVYQNLLQPIVNGHIVPTRFAPPVDRDYVVLVFQLRRYLYGDLSEAKLRRFLARAVPRLHFKGMLSSYPLLDDWPQLKALDGWLRHTVYQALRKRARLLTAAGHAALPRPHGLPPRDLIRFRSASTGGAWLDLRLPSFIRMAALMRRASSVYGPSAIAHPRSLTYYTE